jgi:hypothetical protein
MYATQTYLTSVCMTYMTYYGRYTHTMDVTHIQGTLHTYMQQEAEEQRARDEADHAAALLAARDQALEQGVHTHTHTHTHAHEQGVYPLSLSLCPSLPSSLLHSLPPSLPLSPSLSDTHT